MFKMRRTVLCVDDDSFFRKLYRLYFETCGYFVLTARDGETALEMLRSQQPDALVTDLEMPGKHGLELITEINKSAPELPLVVCSAYEGMEAESRCLLAGAWAFVPKASPFLKDLQSAICKAMRIAHMRREQRNGKSECTPFRVVG